MDFSAILGALVGSFSAAAFSYWYREKQNKQILKINCRLLLNEAFDHYHLLTDDTLTDNNSVKKLGNKISLETWNDLKTNLTGLDFHKFAIICEHFRNMKAMKRIIDSSDCPYPISDEFLGPATKKCEETIQLLTVICYISKAHRLDYKAKSFSFREK